MTQVVAGQSPKPKAKRPVWPWLLASALFLLVVVGVVGFLLLPSFILRKVEVEARAQGVILEGCSLGWSLEHIELTDCSFRLVELESISGTLSKVHVTLVDFEPKSAVVSGAHVVVRELPDTPAGDMVPRWLEQRAKLGKDAKLPVRVEGSSLELFGVDTKGAPESRPLVSLSELEYDSTTEALAAKISVGGMIAGTLKHSGVRSELDVALVMSPETKGRFSIETQADAAEVRVDFEKLPLALFSMPPFLRLPEQLSTLVVDGQGYARVPFGLDTKGTRGDFRLTIPGMPMPVPREIQGLVYGPHVGIDGKFRVAPNWQAIEITKLKVKAGVLELKGEASVELRGLRVPLKSRLTGALSCGAILEAATRAHTDSQLARAAAKLARKMINGSVDIIVAIDADVLRLDQAKVLETIGVGCGLEPLPIPEELARLPKELLDKLPPGLELPDAGITLPAPPRIELPRLPELPRRRLDEPAPRASAAPSQ